MQHSPPGGFAHRVENSEKSPSPSGRGQGEGLSIWRDLDPHPPRYARRPLPEGEAFWSEQPRYVQSCEEGNVGCAIGDQYQLGFLGVGGQVGIAGTKPSRLGIRTFGRLCASMMSVS